MVKIILFISLNFVFKFCGVLGSDDELLSVVAVFRHGDRTPKAFPPNDKYKNLSYWPTEPGELTNAGKDAHFQLGQWLRKRYEKFLPETYHKDDIYVRSTDVDRCLMSAEANLAGLFPPTKNQIWNKKLHWMPIPVHTHPSKDDGLLKMGKACPNMDSKYRSLLENEHFKEIDTNNHLLYEYLSKNLGLKIDSFSDIESPYDTMTIEVLYNLKQPNWTSEPWGKDNHKLFPDEMKIWADLSFITPTFNQELARLGTGRFFDTLGSHFEAVINKQQKHLLANKMALFFAHKSSICDLTHTLGAFRLAAYASSLIFELWQNVTTQSHYLKIYYVENRTPEALTIAQCEENCQFEKFQEIIQPLRMNKTVWKQACFGVEEDEKNGVSKMSISITVLAIVIDFFYFKLCI